MLMTDIINPSDEWDESRIDIVGQNGNEGLHYEKNDEFAWHCRGRTDSKPHDQPLYRNCSDENRRL